jgi:amidase
MSTFIERFETSGTGTTLAVKDIIDMAGVITTAGSKAVAETALPADRDAGCLAGARAANIRIVGKTNLHEFALGTSGINPWYGTPVNPVDPARIPGGSSSGSAVAVATGEADIAYGSDTGGSIRIPAACCGIAGLKTTWGRIPLTGVWPVAPGLDTVGPMAKSVKGLVLGMQLLEPGFQVSGCGRMHIGRVASSAGSQMDAAVDKVLEASEVDVVEIRLEGWELARHTGRYLVTAEAWRQHGGFVEAHKDGIGAALIERFAEAQHLAPNAIEAAEHDQRTWTDELRRALDNFDFLVVPTLTIYAPLIDEVDAQLGASLVANTMPVNFAGFPAVALPVPGERHLPASLQVIGPPGSEEDLLAAALHFEDVAGPCAP